MNNAFIFTSCLFLFLCTQHTARGMITTLNLFERNDFEECSTGTPAQMIDINDDGLCYPIPVPQNANVSTVYYTTYSDVYVGKKSNEIYNFHVLAILDDCDCTHTTGRMGQKIYNQTCLIARLFQPCDTFKNVDKMETYWNEMYSDDSLEYWGVDVNFIQEFMLY